MDLRNLFKIMKNKIPYILILILILINLKNNFVIENFDWDKTNYDFPFMMEPRISHGDKFYLKTMNGKFLTSCVGCVPINQNIENKCSRILCLTDVPYKSSVFQYYKHRDGTFSLETFDFKWLKRCASCINRCDHVICADGLNPNLQTHKFRLIKNHDKTISIKTDNGRLMEVTSCDQSCGKIITSLGLNRHTTKFHIEMTPHQPKQKSQKAQVFEDIPLPFPYQHPYSQR